MEKKNFTKIKGILTDIDGTLYSKGAPIPGAIDTINKLRDLGLKLLLFTNTDSKSPKTVIKILQDYGFTIFEEEIFTPIIALREFLIKNSKKTFYLVSTKEIAQEFQGFQQVIGSEIPDYVIIADFHDNWDVNRLNEAFKYVHKGAKLLGTQGNRYYFGHNGEPIIDTGSFVEMIAYAANVSPRIFGKPSKEYFLQALKKLNLNPEEVLVIGDDLQTDIQGAINAEIKGILVKTGKGQSFDPNKTKIKPFLVFESINSILELFISYKSE